MEMIERGVAHFILTDHDNSRFAIPESAVLKPSADKN